MTEVMQITSARWSKGIQVGTQCNPSFRLFAASSGISFGPSINQFLIRDTSTCLLKLAYARFLLFVTNTQYPIPSHRNTDIAYSCTIMPAMPPPLSLVIHSLARLRLHTSLLYLGGAPRCNGLSAGLCEKIDSFLVICPSVSA
jgi:hypothetical protein